MSRRSNQNKLVEHSDPMFLQTVESPVFEAEDDDSDDIPDEIARLLEQEEKTIRPHQEEQKRDQGQRCIRGRCQEKDLPASPGVFRYFCMVV